MHNFYKKVSWFRQKVRLFLKGKTLYSIFYEKQNRKDFLPVTCISDQEVIIEGNPGNSNSWLFKELLGFDFLWIYLHGSQSDNTCTSFSDYDDLIVVDTNGINKNNFEKVILAFNKVDMRFCQLDYLQHHGHWVISREQLKAYNESYMPLLVLSNCQLIKGPSKLNYSIDIIATQKGLEKNILRTVQSIELLFRLFQCNKINLFKLKGLIGSFVLIPPMLFQLKGLNLSKPEAIKKSHELFSGEAMKCIEWASYCRSNWNNTESFVRVKVFRKIVFLFKDPFKYRDFARSHSPIINLKKMGFDRLEESSVREFNRTIFELLGLNNLR